jgi:bifunctional non-homologous end joining protein LigD
MHATLGLRHRLEAQAPYIGGRSLLAKTKCTQRQEFVIAGYVPRRPRQSVARSSWAFMRMAPSMGRVGTGFTEVLALALAGARRVSDPLHSPRSCRRMPFGRALGRAVAEVELRG